jgi:cytochrome b561
MQDTNSVQYNRVAQILHWLIAIAILMIVPIGLFHDALEDMVGNNYMTLHISLGMTVFGLTLLRVIWRLSHRPPAYVPDIAPWQKRLGGTVHLLFYILTLGLPIGGYIMTSAGDRPLQWFGFNVTKLAVERESTLWELAHEGHELGGKIMAGLVVLHIAAALYHGLKQRDGVVGRMIPGLR